MGHLIKHYGENGIARERMVNGGGLWWLSPIHELSVSLFWLSILKNIWTASLNPNKVGYELKPPDFSAGLSKVLYQKPIITG